MFKSVPKDVTHTHTDTSYGEWRKPFTGFEGFIFDNVHNSDNFAIFPFLSDPS